MMDGGRVLLFIFALAVLAITISQEENQEPIQPQASRLMRLGHRDLKRRMQKRPGERRQKLPGFASSNEEAEDNNDLALTVAVAPVSPSGKPIHRKLGLKHRNQTLTDAGELIKDVLVQLGNDFLMHKVNEDFVFGQYVGIFMRNLTSNLKLKMQHEILETVIRYQNMNGNNLTSLNEDKKNGTESKTEEGWKEFNALAKIVGG